MGRGLSGNHTLAWGLVAEERDAADGGLGLCLDLLLRLGRTIPVGEDEATLLDLLLELLVAVYRDRMLLSIVERLLVDIGLDVV